MESCDEEEAEFRHLLQDLPSTLSAQRGGPHTNSIASAAVRLLRTYNKGKGGVCCRLCVNFCMAASQPVTAI